jgi:Ala-tRNA(Pro) deacylase
MTIAATLQRYLEARGVDYEVLRHSPTPSASRTAQESHISGNAIAKGVVVKDGAGYVLAVLPATHHIDFGVLRRRLSRDVDLASEEEAGALFTDCDIGAVPPVGSAYGLDTILDDSLEHLEDVYFEGGDHTCLLHLKGEQFDMMMAGEQHGHFSDHD